MTSDTLAARARRLPRGLLDVEAVGERLGCSRRRVFDLLARGELERARRPFGHRTLVTIASVERAEREHLTPAVRVKRRRGRGVAVANDEGELPPPDELRERLREQRRALALARRRPVSEITGGPSLSPCASARADRSDG